VCCHRYSGIQSRLQLRLHTHSTLPFASMIADLHEDIRELNLMRLREGLTTVHQQMANFTENLKLVPTRISSIKHFEPVRVGVCELSSMRSQLENPGTQELIKKISQNIGSMFMIVKVQSKLNFYIRAIMNDVLILEEIVSKVPGFGDAPLGSYNPWRNSAVESHLLFRELTESLILEIEGESVKLRHYGFLT
jgi:hypothetical protein